MSDGRENFYAAFGYGQQPPSTDSGWVSGVEKAFGMIDRAAPYYQTTQAVRSGISAMDSQGLPTRNGPDFAGYNYASHSATDLVRMTSTNMDPKTAGTAGQVMTKAGNTYTQIAQSLSSAASNSEYGWTGQAGDATRHFMTGMSKWAGTVGQGATLAGNQFTMQSEAASTVQNSMPQNPTEPPSDGDIAKTLLENLLNPVAGAQKLSQQFSQAAQDKSAAVQAAQTYDNSLGTSSRRMPAFTPPPSFDPNAGSPPPTSTGTVGSLGRTTTGARSTSRTGGGGVSSNRSGGGNPGFTAPSVPGGSGPSGSTSLSDYNPGPPVSGIPITGVPTPPPGDTFGRSPIGDGIGGFPTFGGTLGGGGGGGSAGGPGGLGGSAGKLAGGGAAGLGEVAGKGSGSAGVAARSGAGGGGAAGAAEEEGGAAGAAGKPGAGGAPGGMSRGGAGKGQGDSEHKSPGYLRGTLDDIFGTDVKVAPPVIG